MKLFLAMLLVLAVTGCRSASPETAKSKITVQSVEDDIRAHLPIGSSKADVFAYLNERKIPHAWLRKGEVSPDGQLGFPNYHIEAALIRDVRTEGHLFKTFVSIQIEFIFDDSDSKLVNYSFREVYTGP